MKILVTGAAGFIGSSVAVRLAERGDEVVGIDNMATFAFGRGTLRAELDRIGKSSVGKPTLCRQSGWEKKNGMQFWNSRIPTFRKHSRYARLEHLVAHEHKELLEFSGDLPFKKIIWKRMHNLLGCP